MLVNATQLALGEGAACQNPRSTPGTGLRIGLVNLMPVAAARRTEMEYRAVLKPRAHLPRVMLQCFSESGYSLQRSATVQHLPLDELWSSRLDGLIVTGAEPKAASIDDEPLLPLLRKLVAWSAEHTKSTIFSCFSAHAAVWCLDGIARVRLAEKLFGLFTCEKVHEHPITSAMPHRWVVPHSRYNTLDEAALRSAGYLIMSTAPRLGAEMFLKRHGRSSFLFIQGHLEYGPEVLLSEYHRDLKRFMDGSRTAPPNWPERYLTDVFHCRPAGASSSDELAWLKRIMASALDHSWNKSAICLMDGWLRQLCGQALGTEEMSLACTT